MTEHEFHDTIQEFKATLTDPNQRQIIDLALELGPINHLIKTIAAHGHDITLVRKTINAATKYLRQQGK